jgi:hypothetical protein
MTDRVLETLHHTLPRSRPASTIGTTPVAQERDLSTVGK